MPVEDLGLTKKSVHLYIYLCKLILHKLICVLFFLSLSWFVPQPCRRGDGDCRLEVHGGVSSSLSGWSLPLLGFCPVPFSRTPTQAPQTILTAAQQGIYTHAYTHTYVHIHKKTTQESPPETHRDNFSPCCYLLHYLHPAPNLPLLPHPNLLYLVF